METQWVARVSSKGQFVLPKEVREALGLEEGTLLLIYRQGTGIRLEKAAIAPLNDFHDLAREIERQFEERMITKQDVEEAIGWARKNRD